MKGIVIVLALLLVAPVVTGAATQSESTPGAEQSYGGIAFRTGGVGLDERDAIIRSSQEYPLKLVFAYKDDLRPPFAAAVSVELFDGSKKVFEAHDTGPLLFVDVPPGEYRIVATLNGRTQQETVTLANAQKQVAIYF